MLSQPFFYLNICSEFNEKEKKKKQKKEIEIVQRYYYFEYNEDNTLNTKKKKKSVLNKIVEQFIAVHFSSSIPAKQ